MNYIWYISCITVYNQRRYFYLIFKSVSANNMNWVILHLVRHHSKSRFFFRHLHATAQIVAVKAVTPGGDYYLVWGLRPVSEIEILVTQVLLNVTSIMSR